jgi:hypothetical protein
VALGNEPVILSEAKNLRCARKSDAHTRSLDPMQAATGGIPSKSE